MRRLQHVVVVVVVVVASVGAGSAAAQEPAIVQPPDVSEGATMVTPTDTTPMPVVIEPPSWRLRLGADVGAGVLFPGPAPGGGLALRAGAARQNLSVLVELGAAAGLGGVAGGSDDEHGASAASIGLLSLTPMVQYAFDDSGAFVGGGVVLGTGLFTYSEDRVANGSVTSSTTRSSSFIPGVDARAGWRFGDAHRLTLTAGVKVLATSVAYERVAVPSSGTSPSTPPSTPTSTKSDGLGWAVLPMVSVGYDFN